MREVDWRLTGGLLEAYWRPTAALWWLQDDPEESERVGASSALLAVLDCGKYF